MTFPEEAWRGHARCGSVRSRIHMTDREGKSMARPLTINPMTWPQFWRRAFLLTLPISGPLYVAGLLSAVAAFSVFFFVAVIPIAFAISLWTGRNMFE